MTKLVEARDNAEGQLERADYIDNTARCLQQKAFWSAQIAALNERIGRREADLLELVG